MILKLKRVPTEEIWQIEDSVSTTFSCPVITLERANIGKCSKKTNGMLESLGIIENKTRVTRQIT